MKKFGDFMPELLKQIDNADRRGMFDKKPKGPIGKWIIVLHCQVLFSNMSYLW